MVTNSINQLSRIAGVFSEKEKSLSSLEEYHFFRMRYPITDKMKEDGDFYWLNIQLDMMSMKEYWDDKSI